VTVINTFIMLQRILFEKKKLLFKLLIRESWKKKISTKIFSNIMKCFLSSESTHTNDF